MNSKSEGGGEETEEAICFGKKEEGEEGGEEKEGEEGGEEGGEEEKEEEEEEKEEVGEGHTGLISKV